VEDSMLFGGAVKGASVSVEELRVESVRDWKR
jgi:hypothetical protein